MKKKPVAVKKKSGKAIPSSKLLLISDGTEKGTNLIIVDKDGNASRLNGVQSALWSVDKNGASCLVVNVIGSEVMIITSNVEIKKINKDASFMINPKKGRS